MRIRRDDLLGFVALGAAFTFAVGTAHATADSGGRAPSFRLSDLDGGRRMIEWVSPTNWQDVVARGEDLLVLSVPGPEGGYTNALVLGPNMDVNDVLEEIEELEDDGARPDDPTVRYEYHAAVLYGPSEYGGRDRGERPETEPTGEDDDTSPRDTPPPTIYGEEIVDEKTLKVSYKFFAGDTKPKKAKARIKAARRFYEKAFAWWEQKIDDVCEFDIAISDLGDDTETLTHLVDLEGKKRRRAKRRGRPLTKRIGYSRYTTEAQWAKAPKETWLIGSKERDRLLRSPSPGTRFHLAIFKVKVIAFRDGGKKRNVEHVLFKPAIGILRRPVQNGDKTATH